MENFEDIVLERGLQPCHRCEKYSPIGKAYSIKQEDMEGVYWYYETDSFIIDIHDFYIKKDLIMNESREINSFISISSTYIVNANGEWFNPYQTMTSGNMFVMKALELGARFLLHGNSPYFSVGLNFKEKMIKECVADPMHMSQNSVAEIFFETRKLVTRPLAKLAKDILNCPHEPVSATLFLEAKAREWLSITLNEYAQIKKVKPLSPQDSTSIEMVADYIGDHYAIDISQDILEKISTMSGTKLKNTFKRQYQMSITEYIQRKRMNMAETLLLTTNLDIKAVATAVGYSSHSRFTTLFKRYMGKYPKDIKKLNAPELRDICSKDCPYKP